MPTEASLTSALAQLVNYPSNPPKSVLSLRSQRRLAQTLGQPMSVGNQGRNRHLKVGNLCLKTSKKHKQFLKHIAAFKHQQEKFEPFDGTSHCRSLQTASSLLMRILTSLHGETHVLEQLPHKQSGNEQSSTLGCHPTISQQLDEMALESKLPGQGHAGIKYIRADKCWH